MPTRLIINSDDFGFSAAVNSAVAKARQFGLLTSASLMVAGDAASEAVSIARDDPSLAVGLHLTLSRDKSVLPRQQIPDLVNDQSRFNSDPARASLNYFFNPRARQQLRYEIEAQFEAFAQTGLKMPHVDGHQHLYAHPVVLPIVIELALKYGASGIRIPRDPIWANIRADRSRPFSKLTVALGHAYLARTCRRLLNKVALNRCDLVIGSLMSGNMSDDYVIKMLDIIDGQRNDGWHSPNNDGWRSPNRHPYSIEVFFHPSDAIQTDPCGPNPGDLAALLSPRLKDFIEKHGYKLTNYAELEEAQRERS